MAFKVDPSPAQKFQPLIEWERLPERGAPRIWGGVALMEEQVPKRGILKSKHKRLPDVFPFKGGLVVCDAFREIVEDLEPTVHQFFPFSVISKRGQPVPGNTPYYVLNVTRKLDAILVSRSNVTWMDVDQRLAAGEKFLIPGRGPLQLVMSRPKIAGNHAWRGDRVFGTDLYFSDGLVSAIEDAGLSKLKFTRIDESDETWREEGNVFPAQAG
ncbi:imm11 family protein [Pelagibius marinus]|uniref:imm11 family protein n=1 Tax=Pelagibius marinus TaxID=2762760 RepID=UPI001872967A|nr:DUF1629 domain-containing protein [Pelagibius marinus]